MSCRGDEHYWVRDTSTQHAILQDNARSAVRMVFASLVWRFWDYNRFIFNKADISGRHTESGCTCLLERIAKIHVGSIFRPCCGWVASLSRFEFDVPLAPRRCHALRYPRAGREGIRFWFAALALPLLPSREVFSFQKWTRQFTSTVKQHFGSLLHVTNVIKNMPMPSTH